MEDKIKTLQTLAAKLPTGLHDHKALDKMDREMRELREAISANDTLGAIMEAGDCAYYAIKAEATGLTNKDWRNRLITNYAISVRLPPDMLLSAAIAKYTLRATPGNPKDDQAERLVVSKALNLPAK